MVDGYATRRRRNKTLGRQKQALDHRRSAPFPSNIGRRTTNNSMCPSKTYLAHRLLVPDTDDGNDYTSTRPLLQSTQTPFPRAVSLVIHEKLKGSVCPMPTGAGSSLLARRLFFDSHSFQSRSLGPIAHDTDTQ
jgi:hypothetical protein